MRESTNSEKKNAPFGRWRTADEQEVARFDALRNEWWDEKGPFRALHAMNPVRIRAIEEVLCQRFDREDSAKCSLAGLRILDVGCGGGIACEALAERGAAVFGIDRSAGAIAAAKSHAQRAGLNIHYACADLGAVRDRFDVVLMLELVEHLSDPCSYFRWVHRLVQPGGVLVVSTINRTRTSYLSAIVGAEYILGWLPRGSHRWSQFMTPAELAGNLLASQFVGFATIGLSYRLRTRSWHQSRNNDINYMTFARPRAPASKTPQGGILAT